MDAISENPQAHCAVLRPEHFNLEEERGFISLLYDTSYCPCCRSADACVMDVDLSLVSSDTSRYEGYYTRYEILSYWDEVYSVSAADV